MHISGRIKVSLFFLLALMALMAVVSQGAEAVKKNEEPPSSYSIYLDKTTIAKGYTVNTFDNGLKFSLVPEVLDDSTYVTARRLEENMPLPWNLKRISPIYQFEFTNKDAYNHKKPFYIQFSYEEDSDHYKKLHFYDSSMGKWRPLPTKDHPEENFVRSLIHLPYARIALFSQPNILTSGKASWYSYKGGTYTASPDFPQGSELRVFNTSNGEFVDVTVNDYGPDRSIHPERVVDLDKQAFGRIADTSEGVINVKVKPLHISDKKMVNKVSLMEEPANITPQVTATSGVVMIEEKENILWEEKANKELPLASMTKLVSIYTFLQSTSRSLNETVAYREEDAEKNYKYCKPWNSSEVALKDGDKVTLKDLVYSSLVGSANNTVETLVRVSHLEREEFVAKMNEKVKEWGAENTHFVEPSGLSPQNKTTARDYALIAKKALSHPLMEKASTMPEYEFSPKNSEKNFSFDNTDDLLSNEQFSRINNFKITGSKTGYLHEAGYCLVVRVSPEEGGDFLVVTFGSDSREDSFNNTKKLIKYGLSKVRSE